MLQVQLPQYVDYVKTGSFKELSPLDPDWYYTRAGAHLLVRSVLLCAAAAAAVVLPRRASCRGACHCCVRVHMDCGLSGVSPAVVA